MTMPRILIVDDNLMNIELTTFVLEANAFMVENADSMSAIARIEFFRPDLILMDIQMPGIDGLELTRQLKGNPATSHIVIVAFTAFAMKGDEAKFLAAGCDGYLSKPIDVATFAAQVQHCMTMTPR